MTKKRVEILWKNELPKKKKKRGPVNLNKPKYSFYIPRLNENTSLDELRTAISTLNATLRRIGYLIQEYTQAVEISQKRVAFEKEHVNNFATSAQRLLNQQTKILNDLRDQQTRNEKTLAYARRQLEKKS